MKDVVLAMITSILTALLEGYICQIGWEWVITPIFHMPLITFWQGVGLIVFTHNLLPTRSNKV